MYTAGRLRLWPFPGSILLLSFPVAKYSFFVPGSSRQWMGRPLMAKCCRRKRVAFVPSQLLRVNLFRYLSWPVVIKNANCRYFFRPESDVDELAAFLSASETLARRSCRFCQLWRRMTPSDADKKNKSEPDKYAHVTINLISFKTVGDTRGTADKKYKIEGEITSLRQVKNRVTWNNAKPNARFWKGTPVHVIPHLFTSPLISSLRIE